MEKFTFAHMSDVHLGVWHAHPELRSLALRAFEQVIGTIINQRCSFAIISGDFFDTSMPGIDIVKFAIEQLLKLQDAGIPVYAIAGSHDYSPTGKTTLSVLESARLLTNVHNRLVDDSRTGAQIFGVEGLRGGLDKHFFESLVVEATAKTGFKIFMLHAAIREFAIPQMRETSVPIENLPKDFDYYASGHIHERRVEFYEKSPLVFPGPVFPCDFTELENLGHGSFSIVTVKDSKPSVHSVHINLAETEIVEISADGKRPEQVEQEFGKALDKNDLKGKILLLKSKGVLVSGKGSDINWKGIGDLAVSRGALAVKSSLHITAREMEGAPVQTGATIPEIERAIVESHSGRGTMKKDVEAGIVEKLMHSLSIDRGEENRTAFENKIKSEAKKILDIA
ncbi:MAG: DNA repair exonuclease [Candidatus Aenigmarchaeota archaeon]|nr:DNA repair exonuclease [Candidatus Aenigmarchaeota archaeon]